MPTITTAAGPIYFSPTTTPTHLGGGGDTGSFAGASSDVGAFAPSSSNTPVTNPITGETTYVNLNSPAAASAYEQVAALQGQAVQDTSNAAAQKLIATGDAAEASSYATAGRISGSNANLALQASQLEAYQLGLTAKQTIGSQRADVAASGFREAGSALSILRASTMQAALTQGMTHLQGEITAGGYYAQQAAAKAEELAAATASNAAASLASTDTALGALALAESTNLTNSILTALPLGAGGGTTGFTVRSSPQDGQTQSDISVPNAATQAAGLGPPLGNTAPAAGGGSTATTETVTFSPSGTGGDNGFTLPTGNSSYTVTDPSGITAFPGC